MLKRIICLSLSLSVMLLSFNMVVLAKGKTNKNDINVPQNITLSEENGESDMVGSVVETDPLDVQVDIINDSEVVFKYKKGNDEIKSIVTKDAKTVYSKFYKNNALILEDKRDLKEANKIGNKVKNDYNQSKTSSSEVDSNKAYATSSITLPSGSYMFDQVVYTAGSTNQPYAHPSKSYYSISPYKNYAITGMSNKHAQLNCYDSSSIMQAPAWRMYRFLCI